MGAMKGAILGVALVFTCLLACGTMYVLLEHGPDVFTLFGVIIVALFAFGILGALSQPPDRRS
jgi:drug/metabolite transporter (DMT)-like permease